jgi:hypothetical protein
MKIILCTSLLLMVMCPSAFAKIEISKEILKQRDPFKKPVINIEKEGVRSELEIFPLEKFKMLGVMTGEKSLPPWSRPRTEKLIS